MLGNDLSSSFCTMAYNNLLFETYLRKVLPMNSFASMHIGRFPFPNQIKFIYFLVMYIMYITF